VYICGMEITQSKTQKIVKLTQEQFQRSLKASNTVTHLWLYSHDVTRQKTHNNGAFLRRTVGQPLGCLVVKHDSCIYDGDIQDFLGKDVFIDGGLSPYDKQNLPSTLVAYYYKGY
jgi:hypothetical protein